MSSSFRYRAIVRMFIDRINSQIVQRPEFGQVLSSVIDQHLTPTERLLLPSYLERLQITRELIYV
jgi:hypothetical protein